MATSDIWAYRETTWTQGDLSGFEVEANDGSIGKIDEASKDAGAGFIVVDTGPWIFGKKVLLPAGVIADVDLDARQVYVDLTKDEIKNAPEFDEDRYQDEGYRSDIGAYYGARGTAYGAGPDVTTGPF